MVPIRWLDDVFSKDLAKELLLAMRLAIGWQSSNSRAPPCRQHRAGFSNDQLQHRLRRWRFQDAHGWPRAGPTVSARASFHLRVASAFARELLRDASNRIRQLPARCFQA